MRPLRRDHDEGASPIRDAHEDIHAELGDRYALEDVLGRGGMGTVYLARDLKHDRRVAIKTIHPELAAGVGARRFEREIRITAHLQHPHILPLLDSGVAGDTLFYVMPFIEGDSLRARLEKSGPLSAEEVVRVGNDVLEALDYAHRRDVVHRDIKPDNILLGERHALIADFGIAKALTPTGEESITGTGWRVGSPAYMAPEQAAGEAGPQSDLYALGAVLYEASTGMRWPQTANLDAADWSGVPVSLRGTIRRALAWMPADRWPDAASFRRALRGGRARSRALGFAAVALLAAVGVGVGSWWLAQTLGGDAPSGPEGVSHSIAVLPFENLNGDEETEYFSDGVTEDIIAQLSRIGELDVISRNSSMQYKGTEKSIADIGRELNVGAVLDGSVRRDGDRVRIVSQLIDTRTDATLWGETYDRELTDVFAIQADVAQRIAGALRATITPTERSMIERRPTQDVEAHTLYLRGRYLWNRRTRAGLEGAVDYFRQAAERDPTYAPAFAGLADAYLLLGSYQYMPEADAIRETRTAVERALELDDRLAEAYATLGQVRRSERDWAGEEEAYLRAIELNPNYAVAHQWYATLLAALGRHDEALREIRLAESLDPLSQAISVTAGIVLFIERDFEGAIRQLERTLELAPDYFSAYVYLMISYGETGQYEDAQRAYDRLVELRPDIPQWGFFLATVQARAGRPELARQMIADLTGDRDDRVLRAWVYADLGETDAAFDLLQRELEDDSRSMFVFFRALLFYMDEGMWFDALRPDPRFAALIERERLP